MSPAQQSQRIIITGASSGIGAALAHRYAAAGATLGLIARRRPALERLAAALAGQHEIYPLDVRDGAAVAAAARAFIARHGCPDIVIASAGVSVGTAAGHAEDIAVFQEVLDTNVMGTVKTFHPFISCMRSRGSGALVGIASVAAYRGLPGAGAYSASKAAVVSALESLRIELRGSGVKVITICPGYIATPLTANNPYPMPFLMSVDLAAAKIAALIARGREFAVIPWQMAVIARLMRLVPNWIYDRLAANRKRKPRRGN